MSDTQTNVTALCHFSAADYGIGYLELEEGDTVQIRDAPSGEPADDAWTYGRVDTRGEGWFPTDFVSRMVPQERMASAKKVLHVALGDFSAGDYGTEYVSLHRGASVELTKAPTGEESNEDWSYGSVSGQGVGWFPTQFIWRKWPSWAEIEAELAFTWQEVGMDSHAADELDNLGRNSCQNESSFTEADTGCDGALEFYSLEDTTTQKHETPEIEPEDAKLAWYLQDEPQSEPTCTDALEAEPIQEDCLDLDETLAVPLCFQAHPLNDGEAGKINTLHNHVIGQLQIRSQNELTMTGEGTWRCNLSWSAALQSTKNIPSGEVVACARSKKRAVAEANRMMLWKAGLVSLDELRRAANDGVPTEEIDSDFDVASVGCTTLGAANCFDNASAAHICDAVQRGSCSPDALATLAAEVIRLAENGSMRALSIAFPPLFDRMVWNCDASFISGHLRELSRHCDGRLCPRTWGAMLDSVSRCPDDLLANMWADILSCNLRCNAGVFETGHEAAVFMSCRSWLSREGHSELRQILDPWSGGDWVPLSTPFTVDSVDTCSSSLTLSTPAVMAAYLLKELPDMRDYIVMAADRDRGQRLFGMVSQIDLVRDRRTFRMRPSSFQDGWSQRVQDWQSQRQQVNVMPLGAFGTSHRRMAAALTSATNPRRDDLPGGGAKSISAMARDRPREDLYHFIFSMDIADMLQQWPTCQSQEPRLPLCNRSNAALPHTAQLQHAIADLTAMQQKAVRLAFEQKVTLIQGPPGTGKTSTATRIVEVWHAVYSGQKILCCSDSNAAADNFAAALLRRGIKCIRLGHASDYKNASHLRHLKGYKEYIKFPDDIWRRTKLETQAIDKFGVVVATCVGSGHDFLQKFDFSRVVIDECTQATLLSTFVPLTLGASHLALLGDHKQLPPTVLDSTSCQQGLSRSLFERLIEANPSWAIMLDVQFRMHPSIAMFPSREFYGNRVSSHESTSKLPCVGGIRWPSNGTRVLHVDTQGVEDSMGTSLQNDAEADAILRLLPTAMLEPKDIGIITPYQAQKRLLRRRLRDAGYSDITVDTIDGFQGSERELILISLVRCNTSGRVGFLQDPRRANVALTRARRGLIVIGSRSTLTAAGWQTTRASCWCRWAEWMETNR